MATIPAIGITRWAINSQGDIYRLDGYVGIGTDSPSGLLGLGSSSVYIDVVDGNITFTDVSGTRSVNDILQANTSISGLDAYASAQTESEHHSQLSQAIQTILKDLDGYSGGGGGSIPAGVLDGYASDQTVSEHYSQFSQALQTVLSDLDGYGDVSASSGSDGYVAFFTGSNTIAGDNDFFWDRENNRLGLGTSSPQRLFHMAEGTLYIDNGSLGIGTPTPQEELEVVGDAYVSGRLRVGILQVDGYHISNTVENFVDGYINPVQDDAYGLGTEDLRWKDIFLGPGSLHIRTNPEETDVGELRDWNFGVTSEGSLRIRQSADDYFAITDTGEVGIGTTDPASNKFSVDGGSVAIRNANALRWVSSTDVSRAQIIGTTGDDLIFYIGSGNTERMRIDSTGVGIGGEVPSHTLSVKGNLGLTSASGTEGVLGFIAGTQFNFRAESGRVLSFGANGVNDYITIDTTGFVGINNTNPETVLHAGGDTTIDGYLAVRGDIGIQDSLAVDGYTEITDSLSVVGDASIAGDVNVAEGLSAGVSFLPPRLTTSERDALTPVEGMIIFNTTTKKHQGYDGTSWNDFYA